MARQKPRIGLQRDFQDVINHSSTLVAEEMRELSQTIYPNFSKLFGRLLGALEVFPWYVRSYRDEAETIQKIFGGKSTGRCLELIDFEHRILRDKLLSTDKIEHFCDTIALLSKRNKFYKDAALLCFDSKGQRVAAEYFAACAEINTHLRQWQEGAGALIEEAVALYNWQNDVLIRDVDQPYGAYDAPISGNDMAKEMETRDQYFSELSFHHKNSLLLAEDVVASFGKLIRCGTAFSKQMSAIGNDFNSSQNLWRGPSINI